MKKIMFNDKYYLTDLVLNGIKTQTRRIIKINPEIIKNFNLEYYNNTLDVIQDEKVLMETFFKHNESKLPYKKGEVIAIAQSYTKCGYECYSYRDTDEYMFIYRNNKDIPISPSGVNNKMFVSAKLMPHHIRITDIRIQNLQDISNEDCLAEGITEATQEFPWYSFGNKSFLFGEPKDTYAALINKISGKETWEKNPLVLVYDFELVN